ncbi:MAG: discoidin domain-containing protein [Planctomycetales bacterium]|nr:discoidin domain-containing protein [Planctomycetales bacterium]
MRFAIALTVLVLAALSGVSADDGGKEPKPNQNSLVKEYKDKLKLSASTFWPGWPTSNAFDGDPKTSWFSAKDDAAAFNKMPWVRVDFPDDVTVSRVTILGNREVNWPTGYTIGVGKIELLDKDGKKMLVQANECGENHLDIDFPLLKPIAGVRAIKFVSLADEGDKNRYSDIALGELQVE